MSLFDEHVQSSKLTLPFGICSLEIKEVLILAIAVISVWAFFKYFGGTKEEKEENSKGSGGTFNLLNEGGKYNVKTYGTKSYAFSRGKNDQATVATTYLGPNAVMKGEEHGGKNIAAQGYSALEVARILKAEEEGVKIKILGDQLKNTFEKVFKPGTYLYEVCSELKVREGKPSDTTLILRKKKDVLSDMKMRVEDLGKIGSSVCLWAAFPEK